MKTSALRFLGFSLISIFCGTAAAYDADAKLEEMKALQVAMEQAQQDKNLPEAIRLASLIASGRFLSCWACSMATWRAFISSSLASASYAAAVPQKMEMREKPRNLKADVFIV